MTRATAGLAAALACGALLASAPGAVAGEVPPSRLGVRGEEFSLVLSRARVRPGPLQVQFQNAGEDPHDLRMRRVGGAREVGTGELPSGGEEVFSLAWAKRGARYRLWCSLPDHAGWGMEARLAVRRRR